MKNRFLLIFICFFKINLSAQNIQNDSIQLSKNTSKFDYKSLIIPTTLIGYGFVGFGNDKIKNFDYDLQKSIYGNGHKKLRIDNYLQYTPFLTVYGLNAVGIKGKNNFKDRTIVLGTAYLIMGTTITSIKRITAVERPNGSTKTSFPSGHTATAFMGAELFYQEYKDVSVWYGIVGYTIASGVGFLRMYNNRHWFTDVVTGAGIGILSTKIAYWIHPWLTEKIFKKKKETTGLIVPYYNGKELELGVSISF